MNVIPAHLVPGLKSSRITISWLLNDEYERSVRTGQCWPLQGYLRTIFMMDESLCP